MIFGTIKKVSQLLKRDHEVYNVKVMLQQTYMVVNRITIDNFAWLRKV